MFRIHSAKNFVLLVTLGLPLAACSTAGTMPVPTATAMPSASAPAASPVRTTSPTANVIKEGTYRTEPIPARAIMARINADTKLTASQRAAAIQGFSGNETIFQIVLHGGQLTQATAVDGGAFVVGTKGGYAVPDDHTLVFQEACCGVTTFDMAVGPAGTFSLKIRTYPAQDEEDALVAQIIYESAPFTLAP